MRCLIGLLILMIALGSCSLKDGNPSESSIKDILYDLEVAFNTKDRYRFFQHFHPDYNHDSGSFGQVREAWLNLMASYDLIAIRNIVVEVDGQNAIAYFTMIFTDDGIESEVYAPIQNGELSYFGKDGNVWKVIGNIPAKDFR